jgi:hypothetical protein
MEKLARNKHFSLLGPYVSYEESKVFWIGHQDYGFDPDRLDLNGEVFVLEDVGDHRVAVIVVVVAAPVVVVVACVHGFWGASVIVVLV